MGVKTIGKEGKIIVLRNGEEEGEGEGALKQNPRKGIRPQIPEGASRSQMAMGNVIENDGEREG